MYYFERHQLIETNEGLIVKLYLDRSLSEFAAEFNNSKQDVKENLESAAAAYIQKKLPGKRIKTVVIMMGALVIAAIPSGCAIILNPPDTPGGAKPTSSIVGEGPSARPGEPDKPEKPLTPAETDLDESTLTLVNKDNPLPADYVPADLIVPDVTFASGNRETKQMRQDAAAALEAMFNSARKSGVTLYAVSGYRSYERQVAVFAASTKSHGSEAAANQFSARPGQSEHQTGLAMDVSSASVHYGLSQSFGGTKEGKWLKQNAYRFGFIIRYPEDKQKVTGYDYEPWHVRYVGKDAAAAITEQGITLEEYLGSLTASRVSS